MRTMPVTALVGLLSTALGSAARGQVPTDLTVRVVSHDAKIVGSGVGGAKITILDATTGEVLAEGIQEGETGDTRALVVDPIGRGAPVYDTPGAAHFTASLSLRGPTVVEVIGEGPLGYEEAMQRTSTTLLLLPGEHVTGNGLVLVLHGFIVEILEPEDLVAAGASTAVRARVRMACGCPLEPGGLWDANRVKVSAQVHSDGRLVSTSRLSFAGEPSTFAGDIPLRGVRAGDRLVVTASDPARANFGRSREITVR